MGNVIEWLNQEFLNFLKRAFFTQTKLMPLFFMQAKLAPALDNTKNKTQALLSYSPFRPEVEIKTKTRSSLSSSVQNLYFHPKFNVKTKKPSQLSI